jgi:hypothetical protein
MASENTQTEATPAEATILNRDRGDVDDPIHRVSYSFRHEGSDLWVYTWLQNGGHLPEHYHPSLPRRDRDTSPPPALQRLVLPLLARFARGRERAQS